MRGNQNTWVSTPYSCCPSQMSSTAISAGRHAGNAAGLSDGQRADLAQLLPRLDAQALNGRHSRSIRREQAALLAGGIPQPASAGGRCSRHISCWISTASRTAGGSAGPLRVEGGQIVIASAAGGAPDRQAAPSLRPARCRSRVSIAFSAADSGARPWPPAG